MGLSFASATTISSQLPLCSIHNRQQLLLRNINGSINVQLVVIVDDGWIASSRTLRARLQYPTPSIVSSNGYNNDCSQYHESSLEYPWGSLVNWRFLWNQQQQTTTTTTTTTTTKHHHRRVLTMIDLDLLVREETTRAVLHIQVEDTHPTRHAVKWR
jgi:pyrimidine operon attenuation protein/uracil phosphoribosyltransferase